MELREAIGTRRTVRAYGDAPVPAELIGELVHQAMNAPSACNRRGWKFILVSKREDLDWLYRSGGSTVLKSTRQALLVCYQRKTDNAHWQDDIQSAAAAIAYFQLLAHEEGIGSCWICHLPPKHEVAAYFGIPAEYAPVAVVSFGYYKGSPAAVAPAGGHPQRELAIDRWDFPANATAVVTATFRLRMFLRKLYYTLPCRGLFRRWAGRYEKKFDE